MTTPLLHQVAPNIHVAHAPQRFLGIELGARMTVLNLGGDLLIHSPIALDPSTVHDLGAPRWVLAPNLLHHLYVGPWADAGLEAWAAPGLADKRQDVQFSGTALADTHPFGDDIELLPLTCFPFTNEVVVLHRPSRTLIVSDLVFNVPASAPWATRAAMRCLGGYPGCRTTLLERVKMKRSIARQEIAAIAAWDFDRVIMAHGDIIETGGREALRSAFGWLGV